MLRRPACAKFGKFSHLIMTVYADLSSACRLLVYQAPYRYPCKRLCRAPRHTLAEYNRLLNYKHDIVPYTAGIQYGCALAVASPICDWEQSLWDGYQRKACSQGNWILQARWLCAGALDRWHGCAGSQARGCLCEAVCFRKGACCPWNGVLHCCMIPLVPCCFKTPHTRPKKQHILPVACVSYSERVQKAPGNVILVLLLSPPFNL